MTGDRMVIRKKGKDTLVVDEHHNVRDWDECPDHKDYDGVEAPACNCMPCWKKHEAYKKEK